MNGQTNYDYVVIGAGASGSIVAAQAAAAGHSVLLLDMGVGTDPGENDVWDPSRWYKVLANPAYEIGYHSVAQPQLNNRVMALLQSRGLGGCQLHNAMVYVRGGQATYNHWANALGCAGWDYRTLAPCFDSVESTVGITRGAQDDFTASFVEAAGRLGLPPNPNYNNSPSEFGAVPFEFTIKELPDGMLRRTTSYEGFIRDAGLASLTIEAGAYVRRIVPGNAPSVEYRNRLGEVVSVYADIEVVLAAGSIGSPTILLRSGIGAADALRKLGIAPVADLPGVGQNFYDDLGIGIFVEPTKTLPPQPYGYVAAGAFATSSGDDPGPTPAFGEVNLEVQLSTNALAGAPPLPWPLPASPYLIIGTSSMHLASRGSVTLNSADPYDPPLVDPNWLSDEEGDDRRQCLRALWLAFEIAGDRKFAAEWGWQPISFQASNPLIPLFALAVDEEWINSTGLTVQHYVGSCRMGTEASGAVVDPATLKPWGVEGIRVIDASVAPTPVTGNTAGVSMVIGARGAQLLLAS